MARPTALDDDQVASRLATLPDWQRDGDEIVKTFELPTFPDAITFVTRIAERAEAANHHPDIDIRWNTVRLALTTHDAGGLTLFDLALAGAIDRLRPDVRSTEERSTEEPVADGG
jgi:4a-hydroxytetrahydrobiopterin dehydratase